MDEKRKLLGMREKKRDVPKKRQEKEYDLHLYKPIFGSF